MENDNSSMSPIDREGDQMAEVVQEATLHQVILFLSYFAKTDFFFKSGMRTSELDILLSVVTRFIAQHTSLKTI